MAPYHYLCDGQLSNCVPQPGTERRLDSQGDKIMPRLVYRRIRDQESLVAVHSVNTSAGGGGSAGTSSGSIGGDRCNSTSRARSLPTATSAGCPARQSIAPATSRSAIRSAADLISRGSESRRGSQTIRTGVLTTREAVLVEGEAAQSVMRWEDFTQTAIDPGDDCTIWYVGDYVRRGSDTYSSMIGAFRLPGCRN